MNNLKKITLVLLVTMLFTGCENLLQQPDEPVTPEEPIVLPEQPKAESCPVVCDLLDDHGKLLLGEVEYVTFLPTVLNLPARIDTGATTSSLGVEEQQLYERDGERWVRFSVMNPATQKAIQFKRPVVRKTTIKSPGHKSQSRLVVALQVKLGKLRETTEFTLADRKRHKYPVLIGRNLLRGAAVVDVSQQFMLSSGVEGE